MDVTVCSASVAVDKRRIQMYVFGIGAIVRPGRPFSGPARVYVNIAKGLTQLGVDFRHVVRPSDNIRYRLSPSLREYGRCVTKTKMVSIVAGNPDPRRAVVWISGISKASRWVLNSQIRLRERIAIVHTAHGLVSREGLLGYKYSSEDYAIEEAIMRTADICVFVSRRLADMAREDYGIESSRIRVIPNGIEESYLQEEVGTLETDVDRPKIILAVTGIRRVKGLEFLLDALTRLDSIPFNCVIAGSTIDQKYLQMLTDKYSSLFQTGMVRVLLNCSERKLLSLYDSCSLTVLPSGYEPFGIVALEALARGKPTVVSDRAGVLEFVNEGDGIFSVPYGDVERLRQMLSHLLTEMNHSKYSPQFVRSQVCNLTWPRIAVQYATLFESIAISKS